MKAETIRALAKFRLAERIAARSFAVGCPECADERAALERMASGDDRVPPPKVKEEN